jgi:hypothetical protein
MRPNELDRLSLETLSSQVLEFGTRYKCSSLFGLVFCKKEKSFMTLTPGHRSLDGVGCRPILLPSGNCQQGHPGVH